MAQIFKILALFSVLFYGPMHTLYAKELRVLNAYESSFIFTKTMLDPFLEEIKNRTEGRLTFRLNGPEAVPTFEQFAPVQAGVFDMLFCHPGYHIGDFPLGVTLDAIYADPVKRRESGLWDYVDKQYATAGIKLIALLPQGEAAIAFATKAPVDQTDQPLAGKKIRASAVTSGVVSGLGGAPVLMPGGEVYSALQSGLIDGVAWSLVGIGSYKWHEVAGYWTEPAFGQTGNILLMNMNSWTALPEQDRAIIEEIAVEMEKRTYELYNQLADKERTDLAANGMKPTHFSDDVAGRLGNMVSEAVWKMGMERNEEQIKAFREFAVSVGMTSAE